jgi:hypothetical protein
VHRLLRPFVSAGAVASTPTYTVLRTQIETIDRTLCRMLTDQPAYAPLQVDGRTLRAQLAHTPEQERLQAVWVELLRARRVKRAMRPGMRGARSHRAQ